LKGIRGNKGAAAVEFAILFLLLMIIILGILEFGFIWLQSHYIANSAREGARVAAKGQDDGQVETAIREYLRGVYGDRVDELGNFIEVAISDQDDGEVINVPELAAVDHPPAVRVTVTVRTAEVWEPVLWDILRMLPGSSVTGDLNEITEFAVFAVES
jgi:Flp pilus assembly protein TadG